MPNRGYENFRLYMSEILIGGKQPAVKQMKTGATQLISKIFSDYGLEIKPNHTYVLYVCIEEVENEEQPKRIEFNNPEPQGDDDLD